MISVVIPTYNRADKIENALNSVLDQTYRDIEVLVVDDCSTDNTGEVIRGIGDPRVVYIRLEKNSGACTARNTGIENAKGEYIAFQDSDDWWFPEKLEKQLTFIEKTKADIVFCECARYLGEGLLDSYLKGVKEGKITYEQLLPKNLMSTQTILGKRECFLEEKFDPQMRRLQDWDLVLRLAEKFTIYYQQEVLAKAFIQPDSLTMNPVYLYDSLQHIYNRHIRAHANPITDRNWITLSNGYRELIRRYEDLKKDTEDSGERIADLEERLKEAEGRYEEVVNSGCWKITAPYRKVMDIFRKKEK